MKRITNIFNLLVLLILVVLQTNCKKYLDAKPSDNINIPSKASDLQMLMDTYSGLNLNSFPAATEVQSDNHFLTLQNYNALSNFTLRNFYTWKKEENQALLNDYSATYTGILRTNVVIDEAKEIKYTSGEKIIYDNAVGSAHFFRALFYLGLSQVFIKPYSQTTSATDLGLALREDPDFDITSKRSTVEQTYQFIIKDLKISIPKLAITPLVKSRPSRPAAYAVLARTYLYMDDFQNAELYADSSLSLYSELLDFNTLNKSSAAPFARFNNDVIFHLISIGNPIIQPTRAWIEPSLYNLYSTNDLRRDIYFRANTGANTGTYNFKGNYDGDASLSFGRIFGGIATDEVLLIRAEARARNGKFLPAMEDLNKLLITRWATGTFVPFTASNAEEALAIILRERRKELIYRGTRWSDIRRLKGVHQIIPKRILGDQTYTLESGSSRYTMPFPIEVIQRSGMPQNP